MLTPDGQDWLTRSSRGPESVFGEGDSTERMAEIARNYPVRFDPSQAVVQDFHSVEQALNVASADQRLLVLVAGPEDKLAGARETLRPVINHDENVGRFHVDFESDGKWTKIIANGRSNEGIYLVASGEFGLKGQVLRQLSLDATAADLRKALAESNKKFAATTKKKDYASHVAKGRRLGIRYETAVPFGEDRDGDGEIDRRGGRRPANDRRRPGSRP